ncbi:MAG: phosphodiester glycosidase family protein [Bacteroidales bacterium]|nr:phosphodiester glycosidase family protein [Bacteroidales bacterium]
MRKKLFLKIGGLFFFFFLILSCSSDKESNEEEQNGEPPLEEIPEEPTPEIPGEEDPVLGLTIDIGDNAYQVDSTYLEKIRPGLWYMYAQLKNTEKPLIIHSLRMFGKSDELAVETWIARDSLRAMERPSAMIKRKTNQGKKISAAVNGDFYDMSTGIPLGGEMTMGILTKSPDPEMPVLAFDRNNKPYMDFMSLNAKVTDNARRSYPIKGVNVVRSTDYMVLYNSYFGKYTRTNEWGEEILLSPVEGNWEELDNYENVRCVVERSVHAGEGGSMAIPKGKIVLSGHGTAGNFLRNISVDDEITVSVGLAFQSDQTLQPEISNMIGSYNIILKNNEVLPMASDYLLTSRHPRTSAGFSSDSTYIFLTIVEGRRPSLSVGVTTKELAEIMKYLGAANAVNLDGGGSSCMIADDKVKNFLTDGSERAVANGLLIQEYSSKLKDGK